MALYDDPDFFEAYAQMPRSREGLSGAGEWPQLEPLLPDLAGKAVLDLGCGYGWHSRYCVKCGAARVVGIDASSRMIAQAQRHGEDPVISYRVCDLLDYEYPEEAFDLVLSNLVLHYVADLDAVYRHIWQTLRPGGVFVMNIEHPVFTAGVDQQFLDGGVWPVTDYFYPGARTVQFVGHSVIKQHHTLTQILMGLIRAGFHLDAVEEVMPPPEWRAILPEEMRRPMMLLVRASKQKQDK